MAKIDDKVSNLNIHSSRRTLKSLLLAFILLVTPIKGNEAKAGSYTVDLDKLKSMTRTIPYEDLTKEYLNSEYDRYESFLLRKSTGVEAIIPVVDSKKHFEYPNGSVVNILSNNIVERIDENGNKKTYNPNLYTKLYYENSGLVVLKSKIGGDIDSGGLYRIIFPNGEMVEKEYLSYVDNTQISGMYKIVSSTGEEVYYGGSFNGMVDDKTGELLPNKTFKWIDDAGKEGTKVYVSEEVIGTYGPHFGTEFGIDWYNSGGKLVRTCNFEDDESNRYVGEIRPLIKGVNECVWNDGTVVRYETEDNIILSCTYPNGRTLEIFNNAILVKEKDEIIGTIPLSQPVESTATNNIIIATKGGYIYLIDGEYYLMLDISYNKVTGVKHYDGEDIYTTVLGNGKSID